MQLLHGDCLELMRQIPDGSVDMVLCDLPYGVTDCKWDSALPLDDLWLSWRRVMKPSGVIALFGCEPFSSKIRTSNLKRYKYDWIWKKKNATGFLSAKLRPLRNYENIMIFYSSEELRDTTNFFERSKDYLIEEKQKAEVDGFRMREILGNCMGRHYFTRKAQFSFPSFADYQKLQSTGHFCMPYDDARRVYDEERKSYRAAGFGGVITAVTYNPQMTEGKPYRTKGGGGTVQHYREKKRITRENKTGARYPKQILEYGYDADNGHHPTQKPVALLEYLIKTYTNPGETVLDNCMGSGSTGVACVNTGRDFIGIELDDHYFDVACRRIAEAEEQSKTPA